MSVGFMRNWLFFYFLTLGFITVPINAEWRTIVKGCAITGIALLGIGGAVSFYKWMSHESDAQLIHNVNAEYRYLYDTCTPLVTLFEQAYQVYTIIPTEAKQIVNNVNESVLYELALTAWRNKKSINLYRNVLRTSIIGLHARHAQLAIRLYGLSQNSYIDLMSQQTMREIEMLIKMLDHGLPHFELLRDYLWHHRSYFALFEQEDALRNRYQYELQAITDQSHDVGYIKQQVKQVIAQHSIHNNNTYPYVRYVEDIDYDLQLLNQCIQDALPYYTDRVVWSRWVADCLLYIKGIIIIDPAYLQETGFRVGGRISQQQDLNNTKDQVQRTEKCINESDLIKQQENLLQKYGDRYQKQTYKSMCLPMP